MATTNTVTKTNCGQPSTCETHTPCCPDCGAVECLCRPRFFAGQLLSEQDLNRLDQYIKNKNRLHNRNQHGWGVVNGLKVLCDPCGEVKVTEGYAVDPCGDDIVVCEGTSVNICDLIRQCKQPANQPNCDPFRRPSNSSCDDLEEEWVLTIEYQEWMTRGVTALRGNSCSPQVSQSSYDCGCGGSCTSGSCGTCDPKPSTKMSYQSNNRGAPPECEPTVICEGFRFGVYPKPDQAPQDNDRRSSLLNSNGSFAEAFNCCAEALIATIPPMPDFESDNDDFASVAREYTQWCCRFRSNLLDYFTSHPNTSCEIIDFLNNIVCPSINDLDNYGRQAATSFLSLMIAWLEGVKICICLSLLPSTPAATCDTRVPLATIRVRARDCKVLSICNWTTERKMMVTWPAIGHWFGIFSVTDFLRELLDTICCTSLISFFHDTLGSLDNIRVPVSDDDSEEEQSTAATNFFAISTEDATASASINEELRTNPFSVSHLLNRASADLANGLNFSSIGKRGNNFSKVLEGFAARGGEPLQIGALLNSISPKFKLPTNGQSLTLEEVDNIPLVMIAEIVAKPVMNNILGEKETERQLQDVLKNLQGKSPRYLAENLSEADMLKQLDEMQVLINQQNKQIDRFKQTLNKKSKK